MEKSSGWKYKHQKFLLNRLTEISALKKEVDSGNYFPSEGQKFRIRENGHERIINSVSPKDSAVQHALADENITPSIRRYIIYDNGASLKGKGISFTRKRLEEHLRWHYRRYGRKGYLLLIDFRKYFDNIPHGKVLDMLKERLNDPEAEEIIRRIFKTYEVDVSYSDDPDIEKKVFNSLEYQRIPDELKTGRRFMRKSIGIGSQISQAIGIFYPTPIDNYCKTVKRVHCYDAYMDDRIIIHPNKEFLKNLLKDIEAIAESMGIFINHRKTQIVKLSHGFTWLKTRYVITPTGKIIRKVPHDVVVRERRKLKKLFRKAEKGEIDYEDIKEQYKSWRGDKRRYNARRTLMSMDRLYQELRRKNHGQSRNNDENRNAEKRAEQQ